MKKPGKRNLHRSGFQGCCYPVERRRLQWSESSKGEERNVSYALFGEGIDEGVVFTLRHVVEVLDANDLGDLLSFFELSGRDVAKADVTNQSLALKIGKYSDLFLDVAFGW